MRRFAIPGLIRYVALFNALVFILHLVSPGYLSALELNPQLILSGQIWRLFTWIFIPETLSPFWIFFALLFLLYIGDGLEAEMGPELLTRFYLSGVILLTAVNMIFGLMGGGVAVGRANTFLNLSLLLAFATHYPDFKVLVFFILPVRVVWLAVISAALMIFAALGQPPVVAATLGAAFLNYYLFFRREIPSLFGKTIPARISRSRGSGFRAPEETSTAMHKCAVCGRTEISHPDLDFRVRADGSEYCTEHLPGKSAPNS